MTALRNRLELKARGFTIGGGDRCGDCGRPIEWWYTPAVRRVAFDPMPEDTSDSVLHSESCDGGASFRTARRRAAWIG